MNSTNRAGGGTARAFSLLLGVWLFISAFLWPHTMSQMTNTWICGLIAVVFAAIGMRVPRIRYVNTLLSVWLFISAFALPATTMGTIWNNVLVSIALFVSSLVPGEQMPPRMIQRPGAT